MVQLSIINSRLFSPTFARSNYFYAKCLFIGDFYITKKTKKADEVVKVVVVKEEKVEDTCRLLSPFKHQLYCGISEFLI